ncbi:hypothetical protein [Segeticoccus rhizosphaerae]|uniref:hypothetical protein n=1 Tax=Segeticoccus rhizosphaerae TaxID=1104777 RepID=UPI0010C15549|nr:MULTISPECIES: hypothetical protein [Intrasporangiaceae]
MIALAADEDVSVTAGIGGFLVFFFLAIALWLLMRNMFARIRRVRYREEARLEAERAAAERERSANPDGGPGGTDPRPGRGTEPPGDGTDGTPRPPKRPGDGRGDDSQAP